MASIAVVIWSLWGHVHALHEPLVEGLKSSGAKVEVFQFAETLSDEVIAKMYGNKALTADLPVLKPEDLTRFDGFIFGFGTRYGRAPAQVSTFFDRTGGLWASGALVGKFGALFTSAGTQHGGHETTALTTLPWFTHHGIVFVPLGYVAPELNDNENIGGGSPYGASTISGGDGSKKPTANDLTIAKTQGAHFGKIVNQFVKGASK